MQKGDAQMSSAEKRVFWAFDAAAFVLIVIIGGALHFTWDLVKDLSYLRWLAVFMPVNESNWEHAKLAAWPMLVWAIVILRRKMGVKDMKGWAMPAALAIWSAYIVMFFTHAALPQAFGKLGFVQYIGSFMIGIAHGIMTLRVTAETGFARRTWAIGAVLLISFFAMLTIFTYYPPHIPLFIDGPTGTYGITY